MKLSSRLFLLCCVVAACFRAHAQTPKVITIAGGYLGSGVPATSAALNGPMSVALDSQGNLYVSDSSNCRIRRINKAGVISTFAGTGICGYSGDGGSAHSAKLHYPLGIAFDTQGNLLVADSDNNVIRRITPKGIISTIAGNGSAGYSGDGGHATQATLNFPDDVSIDPSGNVYISDASNFVIRMIDASGNIHTVAGNHIAGFSGDGGPATSAEIGYDARAVLPDGNGSFYIADQGNGRIRKVDSSGTIATFAGNGSSQTSGNGGPATSAGIGSVDSLLLKGNQLYLSTASNIWAIDLTSQLINIVAGGNISGYSGDGQTALSTLLRFPRGITLAPAGDILVADSFNNRVRKIDPSQIVTTVAGGYVGDGGRATVAALNNPWHIAFDSAGNLYIPEYGGNRVRKVSPSGTITTFAGTGITGYSGDGGPATAAALNAPRAIAADDSGNIFIADYGNGFIRKVDTSGTITRFANSINVAALATDAAGNVYASDDLAVWKITPAGSASIFAGREDCFGYSGDDGPATQACLGLPYGLAVDNAGNVYIMDTDNFRVRKVNTSGIIATIAGNGHPGYSGDGGPATAASLSSFSLDVAVDRTGNVYIADSINARVRVVDSSGTIQTFAGSGTFGYNGSGLPATQTNIYPTGLAFDARGILYVSDPDSGRVRKIH
jgi:sugar lactone lactonase YvrE